jgi:polysaccharide chain length determinant protein (PEP-CTERM system associated)
MAAQQQQKPSAFLPALSPLSMLRMLWKRKFIFCSVWVVISAVTYYAVKRIPAMYKAEAVVLVDSQKIPDRLVSSTIVTDPQDRLAAISVQILTNGQLQKIIQDFNLYPEQRKTRYIEDVLKIMRKDVSVEPQRSWTGRTYSFKVSYQGPNARVVARVTNRLANLYVQENHEARTSQAEGTSRFIQAQLAEAKQRLDQIEGSLSQYELKHNGQLPKQESSLNATLSRLTVQLEANKDAIYRAQQTKTSLEDSLDVAEMVVRTRAEQQAVAAQAAAAQANSPAGAQSDAAPRPPKRSDELRAQLNEAMLHYSNEHPEVRRLKGLLEKARQEEAAIPTPASAPGAAKAAAQVKTAKPAGDSPELAEARARVSGIKANLNQIKAEVATREVEQKRILNDIADYQSRVGEMPIREQEMAQLMRDYDTAKANYRSLLDKKISAEMATEMEMGQKAEQFTVAEPAEIPMRPFKPNRRMLYAGGSIFGLALGLLLAFAKELHGATLLGEWELPSGISILGRFPVISIAPAAIEPDGGGAGRGVLRPVLLPSAVLMTLLAVIAAGVYWLSQRS